MLDHSLAWVPEYSLRGKRLYYSSMREAPLLCRWLTAVRGGHPNPGRPRTKQRSERLAQAKEAAGRVLLSSGNLRKRLAPAIKPGPLPVAS
jgi:hypothetical protein